MPTFSSSVIAEAVARLSPRWQELRSVAASHKDYFDNIPIGDVQFSVGVCVCVCVRVCV